MIASSIPQFNLKEVNEALIKLLQNPDIPFDEIYCEPDFATGGIIVNGKEVKESLKNGSGKACRIRAKIEYDKKKSTLTVVEMPYNVYTNTICQQLEKIANSEENPGIERINDFTGKNPCLRIYLNKKANPDKVIQYLYQNTSLQSSYGINMTMLEMGRSPRVFGWKEALQAHLDHEKEVYIRGFKFDLNRIEKRISIIEAIIKAIAKIEEVIAVIKSSASTADANIKLQTLLNINERQAKAILDIKLAKLAKLEISKYEKELKELQAEHKKIKNILNSEKLLNDEIIKGLKKVSKKFGDSRRTEILNLDLSKKKEVEVINPENVVVILTQDGNIKRVPLKSFKVQRRGGKGVKNKDNVILDSISTNTADILMLFTDKGRMYKILVDKIPEGTSASKGSNINLLASIDLNEKVVAVGHGNEKSKYVFFITKKGLIKKTQLEEYSKTKRTKGIIATKLKEGDSLANVIFANEEDLLVVTRKGFSIRFNAKEIPVTGRATIGVKAIKLKDQDEILAGMPIQDEDGKYLAIISSKGFCKKCKLQDFPLQNRGGIGLLISYKGKESYGNIVGSQIIDNNDSLLAIGYPNSICVSATEIPLLNRTNKGVMIGKGNIVTSVIKL